MEKCLKYETYLTVPTCLKKAHLLFSNRTRNADNIIKQHPKVTYYNAFTPHTYLQTQKVSPSKSSVTECAIKLFHAFSIRFAEYNRAKQRASEQECPFDIC